MKYCVALVSLVCVITLAAMEAEAMPPLHCNPRFIDEVPLKIRQFCKLINTLEELNGAIENYGSRQGLIEKFTNTDSCCPIDLSDPFAVYQFLISYVERQLGEIPNGIEGLPLLDSGVKRQDVDHVFLRFGKRR